MTMALCFGCGEIKWGAICPCPACKLRSCGDMMVDIAFSDHHLDVETLKEFGGVIRAIQSGTGDPRSRFWAFIHYVSEHHPGVLTVNLNPEMKAKVEEVLRGVVLPSVNVRASPIHRHRTKEPDDDS